MLQSQVNSGTALRAGRRPQERSVKCENQRCRRDPHERVARASALQEGKQEQDREELGQKQQRERTDRKRRAICQKEKECRQECDDGERIKVTGHRKRNEHSGIPRVGKRTMQRPFHRGQLPRGRPPPTAASRSPSGPSKGAYDVSGLFSTQTYDLTECIGTSIFVPPALPHTAH